MAAPCAGGDMAALQAKDMGTLSPTCLSCVMGRMAEIQADPTAAMQCFEKGGFQT